MSRAASVVALTFSIPDATKSSTAVCAYCSHGYATPNRSEKKSSIALVWLNVGPIVSSIPRGTLNVMGISRQVSFFSLYSPATKEIRYVETGKDCRHVHVFSPLGASCTLRSFPLETVS